MNTPERFKTVYKIYPPFTIGPSTSGAVTKEINGRDATIDNISGTCYINPITTAASTTSIQMSGRMTYNMKVMGNLSVISSSTATGEMQVIVWES